MDDDLCAPALHLHPTPQRPLLGTTVLLVEDSRFSAQGVRLMAKHSGARLRHADSLVSAHRHLAIYRPMIVIVDMGLPDGNGAELIAELNAANPRVPVLVGTSGDPGAEAAARAAGADGFLQKPVDSLAAFQQVLVSLLPAEEAPRGPRVLPDETVDPDREALADDLAQAARLIQAGDEAGLAYAAQFLGAVARASHDADLETAASILAGNASPAGARALASLVTARLAELGTPA